MRLPLYQSPKPVPTFVLELTLSNTCPRPVLPASLMVAVTSCLGMYKLNPEPCLSVSVPRFHTLDVVKFYKKKWVDVGLDPTSFSWYSFRRGGASSTANGGISDRMFRRNSRLRSENDEDGYVNVKAIFAVMNTTWAAVKIRPEKKFRPARDLNPWPLLK